jgi:hypothetical protein
LYRVCEIVLPVAALATSDGALPLRRYLVGDDGERDALS